MPGVGRQHLTTLGGVGFALKGDAFYVESTSDRNARLPEVREDAKRVRLLIEGRHTHRSGRKTRLSQSLELGARWDRGRVENGRGMDVGGGIEYAHTERGISLSARGRYLLLHEQAAFEEWGASLILRFNPGYGKQGLVLDVSPVWGAPTDTDGALWLGVPVMALGGAGTTGVRPDRLKVDAGYRFVTPAENGSVTPYGGWSTGSRRYQRYRLGGRMAMAKSVNVNLEGICESLAQGTSRYGIRLFGRFNW